MVEEDMLMFIENSSFLYVMASEAERTLSQMVGV
jgi:hypothetical protein